MTLALAHDYVTQRGGAERVALAMTRAFPGSPLHTALYDPAGTFPEFEAVDIRTMPVDRWGLLRRHHRLALPFLARAVSDYRVDADVLLASSSGWAHGIPVTGRKVVYCHAPARWLYQSDRYAGGEAGARARAVRAAIGVLGSRLRQWDRDAAASADRYLVNSTVVQRAVRSVYGIEAEVLPPPPGRVVGSGAAEPVPAVAGQFLLCVARLLPYKNVDLVIDAVASIGGLELVIVGDGPERARLSELARRAGGVHLLGRVSDAQLQWLYANAAGLVAASYEDFGLSPLEAGMAGKPTAALRDGGYLDTVVEGRNGVFFDTADAPSIAASIERLLGDEWSAEAIREHAATFSEERFADRLRAVVAEEAARV
ncbi:glycosyltransferase [Microbacterium sp. CPCC 204701]|uniref:glycosyltransferase n=1 Tax=Microbacterium sp. CPCC 204701 TaxID=2493084 RepID=UPI001F0BBCB8|nr:glycosyltransferase [Microbacterium sp. CPCC 204701]